MTNTHILHGLPGWLRGKESVCNARDAGEVGSERSERVRKIPWRRAWQPTPVFLPGESHGQRRLAGYSPGREELSMTEVTTQVCISYLVFASDHLSIQVTYEHLLSIRH